jgi:predicted metal-binding membrane protein
VSSRSRAVLRDFGRRPPMLAIGLGIAASWALLALASTDLAAGTGPASQPLLWICTPGMASMGAGGPASTAGAGSAVALLTGGLPMWGLMAAAMMLPTALPAVRHVAVNSLYWRRRRAMAEFIAVFLVVWILFSAVALGALSAWGPASSAAALAGALALAALWQLTPLKLRALRACHRSRPLPPRGWRATAGVADFGLRNGAACLASCWAMMLTMATVSSARLAWMACLTGVAMAEKLSLKPVRTSRRTAALLAAAALGCAAIVLL